MAMATDTDGLTDRFAAIAAIDAEASFGRFDADQLEDLRRYSRVCTQLNRREVLRRPIRFFVSTAPTGGGQHLEHAGEEALRSAMIDFRLLWMDGEPTQFGRMRNLVRAHIDISTKAGREALGVVDALGRDMNDAPLADGTLGTRPQRLRALPGPRLLPRPRLGLGRGHPDMPGAIPARRPVRKLAARSQIT
jgi:hypothetical protein